MPDDTQHLIENFNHIKEAVKDKHVDSNDINEGLSPFNIDFIEEPGYKVLENPSDLKEYNAKINETTPSWLSVYFEVKGKERPEITLKSRVDETKFGDRLINHDNLLSFPGLKGGAVYNPRNGSWKIFKDNEANIFVESRATDVLKQWNAYSNAVVTLTWKYVQRTMYRTDVHENPFDTSKPHLAAFENGTFNIKTGELEANSPENYLLNGHDYEIDTTGKATPHTDNLFKGMVGEASDFLMEYIGYGFYRSYRPFQLAVFLSGNGGEGKSAILVDLLAKHIFGSDNYSAVAPDELTGNNSRFKPAQLYGKEMNIVADIPKGYLANTAILKKLTGGDSVDAEFKSLQNFTFTNYAKMIFSANSLPTFNDNSDGFRQRLVLINFINGDTRTDNKDFWKTHSIEKAKSERGAFVYKCLMAFRKAMENNQMSLTKQMQVARDEWVQLNDHFGQFLEEACIIDTDDNRGESTKVVVAEYKAFCIENNYSDKTTAQTITENLKKLGVIRDRSTRGFTESANIWRFTGLRVTKSYINPLNN